MSDQKYVIASFHTALRAREAVAELERSNVPHDDISVIMNDKNKDEFVQLKESNKASEGAGIGGAVGTALGALAAGITAVATVTIPGAGVLAAGPIVAALAGGGAGAAAGGTIGGLVGLGIDKKEAKFHENTLEKGGVLVAVSSDDKSTYERAKEVLDRWGIEYDTGSGVAASV